MAGVYDPHHDRAELRFRYLAQRDPDVVFVEQGGAQQYDHPTVARQQSARPDPRW